MSAVIKFIDGDYADPKALADYITAPHNDKKQEKCVHEEALNFSAAAFGPDGKIDTQKAVREMKATQNGFFPGKKNVTAHIVMSWKEDFSGEPIPKTPEEAAIYMKEALTRLRADIDSHQVIIGVHNDNGILHVHAALNKVSTDGEFCTLGFTNNDRLYKKHAQKVIVDMSYAHGWHIHENNKFEIGPDGQAVKRQSQKKVSRLNTLSAKAKQYESHHPGKTSTERKAKDAAKLVLPTLTAGMGLSAVREAFAAQGLEFGESDNKRGLVWKFQGGKYHFKGSDFLTLSDLAPYIKSATAQAATATTLKADLSAIRADASKIDGWPGYHRALAERGITLERAGGTSRQGGELRYVLADGSTISGQDAGASLSEMEKEFGATFRNVRKKERAELAALVAEIRGDKPAVTVQADADAAQVKADKDAAAEAIDKAFAQGQKLTAEQKRELAQYFRDSRQAKELAKMIRRQGYDPKAVNKILNQLRKGSGFSSPERAAIAAIAVLLKMVPALTADLSGMGSKFQRLAERITNDAKTLTKDKDMMKIQADTVEKMNPDESRAIYKAQRADILEELERQGKATDNPFLISGHVATRLRQTGHTQSEIVAVLREGGEPEEIAEQSAFYAYSKKGDERFYAYRAYRPGWQKVEDDARKSLTVQKDNDGMRDSSRFEQNNQNTQQQTHSRNSGMKM
ncbi:MAG: hypothetical protein DELT_02575 [Desulfovibrio sp.]